MNVKKGSSLNSPLKKTTFPIDITHFQNSSNSSQTTNSAKVSKQKPSILICQKYRDEATPNLFQYNDRHPLLLSSDDEEGNQQPPSNHYEVNQYERKNIPSIVEYQKGNQELTNDKQKKETTAKDHIFIKDFNENESQQQSKQASIQIKHTILPKESKYHEQKVIDNSINNSFTSLSPKKWMKKLSVTVAKSKQSKQSNKKDKQEINEYKQIDSVIGIKNEKVNSQIQKSLQLQDLIIQPSKSQPNQSNVSEVINKGSDIKGKRESQGQLSSISSNTGHILQKINHKDDSISLGQPQQTQRLKKEQQDNVPPAIVAENQLNTSNLPQKRRRNRIFEGSSARNKNKLYITPEKGVQTEENISAKDNNTQLNQYELYPQIKALNILGKLVDQITPKSNNKSRVTISKEQSRQIWSSFIDSLEILDQYMLTLRNINEVDEIQSPQIIRLRVSIKKILKDQKGKLQPLLKKKSDDELQISQIRLLSKFQQIQKQFQIVDFTLKNMIDSKYSLASLTRRTKDLMVLINKGEYKKTYSLLEDFSLEIQKMKNQRASCGTHRLQKIFRQFLEGQIQQLEEVQIDFRNSLKGQVDYFKL